MYRHLSIGLLVSLLAIGFGFAVACGDDGNEAVDHLIGAECTIADDCDDGDDDTQPLQCLTEFGGGYCGDASCLDDDDCLTGSACVTHTNGTNYCFLLCNEKVDCNHHRSVENEANCVGSIVFVEEGHHKACEPPSSGI